MPRNTNEASYGIIVVVHANADAAPGATIERSLNGVTGWEEVGFIPSVLRIGDAFVDELPNDGITRFYRARHIWESGAPGEYTNIVAGQPILINPNLDLKSRPWPTEVPVNTVINIDDDGNASLFMDGSFRSKSVKYAFVTASADFTGSLALPDIDENGIVYNFDPATDPTDPAFITPTNPEGLLGITEQDLEVQLEPGTIIRTGVKFYTEQNEEGRLLATHYEVARYIDPEVDAVKLEPDFIVSLDYFNSGSNDDPFVKVILDVIDPSETLDRIEYFFSEGPISELPDINDYDLTWTPDTSGPLSSSYTQDVKLNEKHFGVLAFAAYWTDADETERVFTKILYLDVGDDANIVNINVSYDDNGDVALIQVKGDADTRELRAQEFIDGDWVNVVDPTPAFTDGTKFSDTRRGSFSVDTAETEQRLFRVFGRNNKDIDGPKEEFFINSRIDFPTVTGEPFITIDYVAPTEPQGGETSFNFRSIVVQFELTGSGAVQSVRVLNNSIGIPVENLDSSVLTTAANWTQVGTNAYQWVITDNSLNPIDFPIPYGSDVGITLQAFSDTGGNNFLGEARDVFRDETTFGGLVFVSGSQQFNSATLNVGAGLKLQANSPVTMSIDASNLPTIEVGSGGTGLTNIPLGNLLVGSGSELGLLDHPDSGGTIRVLQASGSITERKVFWAEAPVAGVAAVGEGNGIEVSGTGANPVVSSRIYTEGSTITPPADTGVMKFVEIDGKQAMGIALGTGAREAAAGNHTHDFSEILNKPANLVSSSAQVTELLDTGSAKFTQGVDKRFDAKGLFSGSSQVQIDQTTGTLSVGKGGTGLTTIPLGNLIVGSGSSVGVLDHPDSGGTAKVLQASGSIGSRVLYWADPPVVGVAAVGEGNGIQVSGTGQNPVVSTRIYTEGSTLTPPANTGVMQFVEIDGKQAMGVVLGSGPREAAAGNHIHDWTEITNKPAGLVSGSSQVDINSTTGTLAVNKGGTGATDAGTARTNLDVPSRTGGGASGTWGIAITGNAATATTAGNVTGTVAITNGGTGATTAANARTNLDVPTRTGGNASGTWGISITGNAATATTAGNVTGTVAIGNGGTGATTAANARTNLDVPTRTGGNASGTWGINITGNAATATTATSATTANSATTAGNVTGTVAIANGGTGATNAATARSNLGAGTVTQVNSGNGMSFTGFTGSGTITLGTPSTLGATSTNGTTSTSHTHALDGNIGRVFVQSTNPSGTPARAGDITFVI